MSSNDYGRPIPPGAQRDDYEPSRDNAKPKHGKNNKKNGDGNAKGFWFGLLGGLVACAIVICFGAFTPIFNGFRGTVVSSPNGTISIDAAEDPTLAEVVAAKCLGSVVTIYVTADNSSMNQYFSGSSSSPSSLGSGVIMSDEGDECYIVTNAHVVSDASKLSVKVGEEEYEGTLVGADVKTDLAVVKIKTSGLTPMEFGNSENIKVGEWVMAIGSPFGYEQTVTTGIVSAMYRSDILQSESGSGSTVYTDMIQTDAAINPGNSGGALVDAEGKLIGINTYISSSSQSSAGLGFAIPVNTVKSIAEQIVEGKTVSHAFLGITMSTSNNPAGVLVTSVYKDTAAAAAGLKTGDVITKINGSSITSPNEVSIAVSSKKAGDTLDITYMRNGQEQNTTATLGSDEVSTSEYADGGEPATSGNGGNSNGGNNGYGYGYGNGNGNSGNGGGFFPFPFGF